MVVLFSAACFGHVVFNQASSQTGVADRDLHDDVDACLFGVSGKRGYGLPAAFAVAGVLLHLRGGRRNHHERARGESKIASANGETGIKGIAGCASPGATQDGDGTVVDRIYKIFQDEHLNPVQIL